MDVVEGNEQAEAGHAADCAAEYFAHFVLHVVGFEPVFHVAAGFVGTALALGTVDAQRAPVFGGVVAAT